MDRVPERVQRWWGALDDRQRRHGAALSLAGVAYLVHYLVFTVGQPFFIEDAAITFAYARNVVAGEGFATFAGGERVEGYSNALWTFIIAVFYGLGVPGWVSSKVLGAVFGLITLPLSYAVTRRALAGLAWSPDEGPTGRVTDAFALLAPILLALSPQIVIWNASGLENSLFGLLLTAGIWRVCVEHEEEGQGRTPRPWSAVLFFLLTMTRPDGMMYAAVGLTARLMSAVGNRRVKGMLLSIAAFALPFLLYNAWRYWYFAWPFPNTYYAKLGTGTTFQPFGWTTRGWKQIIGYFTTHKVAYALPLLPLAMTGLRGWRRWLGFVVVAWLSLVLLWDGREGFDVLPGWLSPISGKWVHLRVWSLLVGAVVVGLANFGREGWLPRGALWASFCGGIFFVVYSGNDWMKAWRWFNLIGFSMFPLLAIGLAELLDGLPLLDRRLPLPKLGPAFPSLALPSWALVAVPLLVAFGRVEIGRSVDFVMNPETSTRDIRRRVDYMQWVQRRLDIDDVTLLDVDMGAHMYFSDWRILDIAGLVDVPIARHRRYDKDFVREYIFREEQPDFAHVHSSWARTSKINTYQEWKEGYLEIPGYPIGGRKLHVGNHIKKAHLVTEDEAFPESPLAIFDGGIRLLGVVARSTVVPSGGRLYLHLVFNAPRRKGGFDVLAFLDDGQGHRSVASLTPGFDWYPPEDWKRDEQVHGRFRMPVGADLPPGDYQLGLVLVDRSQGGVLALRSVDGQVVDRPGDPVYLAGEMLVDGVTVQVSDRAGALAAASEDLQAVDELVAQGQCEPAWTAFKDATRHLLADIDWRASQEPRARRAVAACWVQRARAADDEADRAEALLAARRWDHHVAGLAKLSAPEADRYVAEGDRWFDERDWERAYDRYALALRLDPSRSHVRRRAEDARDYKHGIRELGESYPPDPKKQRARERERERALEKN